MAGAHTKTETEVELHHVTVTCSCGKRYEAPNEHTADARLAYHKHIEEARAALRGARPEET